MTRTRLACIPEPSRCRTFATSRKYGLASLKVVPKHPLILWWRWYAVGFVGSHPSCNPVVWIFSGGRSHARRLGLIGTSGFTFDLGEQLRLAASEKVMAEFPGLRVGTCRKQVVYLTVSERSD
jgi:hypothetical protein